MKESTLMHLYLKDLQIQFITIDCFLFGRFIDDERKKESKVVKQIGNVTADTEFTFEYGIRIKEQIDEEDTVMETKHKEKMVSMEMVEKEKTISMGTDKKQEGTNTYCNDLEPICNK